MLGMKIEAIEWGSSGVALMGMGNHRLIESNISGTKTKTEDCQKFKPIVESPKNLENRDWGPGA